MMKLPLTDNSKYWYRMHSVQAALLLVFLETIQALDLADLPSGISISIALAIPVLRVIKQEAIKAGE